MQSKKPRHERPLPPVGKPPSRSLALKPTGQPLPPAHDGVYARLGASALHGVGVFAILPISKSTNIFGNDAGPIVWASIKVILDDALTPALQRLYRDFGVVRGDLIGVPVNFNSLSPGWYVNEPAAGQDSNVVLSDDFHFIAVRDIEVGEELTTTYALFSDASDLRAESFL